MGLSLKSITHGLENAVKGTVKVAAATAGFQVGGTTGAALATGNADKVKTTLGLDAAGLALATGYAAGFSGASGEGSLVGSAVGPGEGSYLGDLPIDPALESGGAGIGNLGIGKDFLSTVQKGIGTLLGIKALSYSVPQVKNGQADVSPVYSSPWPSGGPGASHGNTTQVSSGINWTPYVLIGIAILLFVFLLKKGR